MLLDEAKIASTFVFYGSARIPEPAKAEALLALATDDKARKIAERLVEKSKYYEVARELARIVSVLPRDDEGNRQFVVCSGGGPSIMEAANRGAHDVGAESIGLNIVLPHEQAPNPYVTPSLSTQFHYFALRKMHFLLHARALAAFPGGFGTFDELFELLTLIQTGKIAPIPCCWSAGSSGNAWSISRRWSRKASSVKRTCRSSPSSRPRRRHGTRSSASTTRASPPGRRRGVLSPGPNR